MLVTTPLRLAICLFPGLTSLDYIGPVEVFSWISPDSINSIGVGPGAFPELPRVSIELTFVGYNLDPMIPNAGGPGFLAQKTYDELNNSTTQEQFDIILVPGGPGASIQNVQPSLVKFLENQAPGADYILSVCTGAWILANAGLLDGKNATTNKAAFKQIKANTSQEINWIPKARWVVDGNVWTSSGVSAGTDMAAGFLEHLVGESVAEYVRAMVEVSVRSADDDEFAAYYGLV